MTLTNFPYDPLLDLAPWVGQRQATFRFELINGISGQHLGDFTPIRNAQLSHDTTRTIKRQLTFNLGKADTAAINTLTDRVRLYMLFGNGSEYPMGRYMFTDASRQKFTSGNLGDMVLYDEMFLVDQQILAAINGVGKGVASVIQEVLFGLGIAYSIEASPYMSAEAWSVGAGRGGILSSLAISGDYFNPWFNNEGVMTFIRSFNPANQIADFDFDSGNQVVRSSIVETDNLLTAPNTFLVISNSSSDPSKAVYGSASVPTNAPNSVPNRGFAITSVQDLQLTDSAQAQAVAQNLAIQNGLVEQVTLSTAPDPRFDSYNVVHWQGSNWLEFAWSMGLQEGQTMTHSMKKGYAT